MPMNAAAGRSAATSAPMPMPAASEMIQPIAARFSGRPRIGRKSISLPARKNSIARPKSARRSMKSSGTHPAEHGRPEQQAEHDLEHDERDRQPAPDPPHEQRRDCGDRRDEHHRADRDVHGPSRRCATAPPVAMLVGVVAARSGERSDAASRVSRPKHADGIVGACETCRRESSPNSMSAPPSTRPSRCARASTS